MIDTYWQNFIDVFKDTLGKIGSDIQREEGRSIEDIISEKIVTLLGYFNNDYNRDDMVDMEEVSKVYIIALKLIFFLNKNIRDDYFFYDTFKEIIKKEIYMTTKFSTFSIGASLIGNIPIHSFYYDEKVLTRYKANFEYKPLINSLKLLYSRFFNFCSFNK